MASKKKKPTSKKKKTAYAQQSRSGKKGAAASRSTGNKSKAPAASRRSPGKSAKKISSAAARRRKRLMDLLMYLFVLIAVASLMIVMALTVFFEIETVAVVRTGDVPYSDEEIIAASDIRTGENLLMAQTENGEEGICLYLPYIEYCDIRRALPSTLVIEVESVEIAGLLTLADGQQIIVSTTGKAVAPAGDAYAGEGLTVINGITAEFSGFGVMVRMEETDALETAGRIRGELARAGLAVDSITFDENGTVSFMYDGRIKCKLGLPTDLDRKLLLISTMLTDGSIFDYEQGVIDASIDDTAYFTTTAIMEQYGLE